MLWYSTPQTEFSRVLELSVRINSGIPLRSEECDFVATWARVAVVEPLALALVALYSSPHTLLWRPENKKMQKCHFQWEAVPS
jgi:hypothetical protein